MKGRREKPYSSETLLGEWRELLERLNRIKADPACDLDPEAVARVTETLQDKIDAYRPAVALESAGKITPEKEQFATRDNPPNNATSRGTR